MSFALPITNALRRVAAVVACLGVVGGAGCDNDGGAPATVAVSGGVGNFVPAQGFVPLDGVNVCIADRADVPCTVSDADGLYTLTEVPTNSDLIMSFTKVDYVPQVGLLSTEEEDVGPVDIRLALEGAAKVFFEAVGASYPLDGKGGITFGAYPVDTGGGLGPEDGIAGWLIEIAPQSGVGPVFVNNGEFPDETLQQTQLPGWGLFTDITPGTVRISFTKNGESCPLVRPGYGWSSMLVDETHIDVPVFPDMLTAVGLLCTR